ncbi:MAG: AAA family ATPase [Paludibacteraceae bacterium]|nr:AAA family ATPase [Paludibacteraceae bacterium]
MTITPIITPKITVTQYEEIESSVNDLFHFLVYELMPQIDINSNDSKRFKEFMLQKSLERSLTRDLFNCYNGLGYAIDFENPESIALMMVFSRAWVSNPMAFQRITYDNIVEISRDYRRKRKELIKVYYEVLTDNWYHSILETLQTKRHFLLSKYVVLLYRFTSLIAKIDGVVTPKESAWLNTIISWKDKTYDDENMVKTTLASTDKVSSENQLEELIGLETVKQQVHTLKNYITIQQERVKQGMKSTQVSYHCIFSGNPGTGKTTVARVVAQIYKELGVLKIGQLVETDRSGLVAEYVGQTAVKTNKIIDSALDGVLFIDEAYSLIGGSQSDYGKEAIATLVKRMEDNRDRLVVILAGYKNEMRRFLDSNPGLQSRFNRIIDFPDYTADELYQIFEINCKKFEYSLSETASIKLKAILNNAILTKDKGFGNGRYVRNLFEKTIENQANRLSQVGNLTKEILSIIEEEDLSV